MSTTLKHILLAVIGILIPILYTLVTTRFPEFPLPEKEFTGLIIWAVGLLIGGWNLKGVQSEFKRKKNTKIYYDLKLTHKKKQP